MLLEQHSVEVHISLCQSLYSIWYPVIYQMRDQSQPYAIVNTQFTYNIKKFEVYIGVENIFNFRQNKPIISWQDPFGQYFDTQFAWGPTRGRESYLEVRFTIKYGLLNNCKVLLYLSYSE